MIRACTMVSGFGVQQMHCRTLGGRTNCTRAAAELVVKCGMPSLLRASECFQDSNCETQAPLLDKYRRGPTVRGAHFAPGLCVGIVNGGALTARWQAGFCKVCWRGFRATDGRRLAHELWLAGCAMASWLYAGEGVQVTTDGERRKVSGLDLPGPISAVLMMR